jgi:hypothetical protein
VVAFAVLFAYLQLRKRRKNAEVDDFFSNLDGDKFNLKLPPAVDDYYEVKGRCEGEGWEPGQVPENPGQPSAHHRMLAQALMKRCIADIPIVSHIQRESAGMNKLYSQSMCSVKQWKSYQAAEAMVSAEVEEVRAEADEIEPGWSNVSFSRFFFFFFYLLRKIGSNGRPVVRALHVIHRGHARLPLPPRHAHASTPPPSFPSLRLFLPPGGMETGDAISQHAQAEGGAGQGAADGAG